MSNLSLCDRAKAILNLDNTCQVSSTIASLGAELPVHLEEIQNAAETVREALATAPDFLEQEIHQPAMAAAQKVQSYVRQGKALADFPFNETSDEYAQAQQYAARAAATARNTARLINTINCVSRLFTDHAVPGTRTVAFCMDSIGDEIRSAMDVADTIRYDWGALVDTSVNFITDNIDNLIAAGIQSNGFTECLAGLAHIPPHLVGDISSRMSLHKVTMGKLGKQLSGCAGRARDAAKKLRSGADQLRSAKDGVEQIKAEGQQLLDDVQGFAATLPIPQQKVVKEIISGAESFPNASEKLEEVATVAEDLASQVEAAADSMDVADVSFTYGHELKIDRVGNYIRIFHKDGHYSLYNATNIIHAADQTNKHLLWLENAIQKFNSHTHLYNPGPGAPTPTRTPLPTFDMSDGTSVTKAG